MNEDKPLALRPGQTDWETEMWAREVIALVVDGKPPNAPLIIPPGAEDMIWEAVGEVLADLFNPER